MAFFHKHQIDRDRSNDWKYNTIAACAIAVVAAGVLWITGLVGSPSPRLRKHDAAVVIGSDIQVTVVRTYRSQVLVVYVDHHGVVHEQLLDRRSLLPVP